MKHASLTVVLILALTAPLTAVAHAGPPEPTRPADVRPNDEEYDCGGDNWHEGGTGLFEMDQSDADETMSVRVLEGRWLELSYGTECRWYRWYHTRGGSRFYLNFCDQHGDQYLDRVSRKQFLDRVGSTWESSVLFRYNRDRDRGVFQVRTYWDEPCQVRER